MNDKCERFIECAKWIGNEFIERLRWILFPLAIITLFLTLFVACSNFFYINSQVQVKIEDCLTAIKADSLSIVQANFLPTIKTDSLIAIKKGKTSEIIECIQEIKDLKKGVFDSNTITFLVSFILVFLGSIWLNIEGRAKKYIGKAKKAVKKIEAEQNILSLHSQILAIRFISINYQNALNTNNGDSIMFLNHKMYLLVEEVLRKISADKQLFIIKEKKKDFDDIFEDIINNFEMDEETLSILPENSARRIYQNSINQTIEVLKELRSVISKLRERANENLQ